MFALRHFWSDLRSPLRIILNKLFICIIFSWRYALRNAIKIFLKEQLFTFLNNEVISALVVLLSLLLLLVTDLFHNDEFISMLSWIWWEQESRVQALLQLRCCRAHFSFLSYFIAHIIKYFGIYNSFRYEIYVFCRRYSVRGKINKSCILHFLKISEKFELFFARHNLYNNFHYNFCK